MVFLFGRIILNLDEYESGLELFNVNGCPGQVELSYTVPVIQQFKVKNPTFTV